MSELTGQIQMESPLVQIDLSCLQTPAGLEITELSFQGHINLRGRPDNPAFLNTVTEVLGSQPPLDPNTFIYTEDLIVYWLGPDEWLIVTIADKQSEILTGLSEALTGVFSSITDISSGQTILRLRGEGSREVLQKGCTIDLHPRAFKPGDCAQTRLGQAGILIAMVDETPGYDIIVRRSFADYLGLWFADKTGSDLKP